VCTSAQAATAECAQSDWAWAGEAKIKKAKQLGTHTIDEDGLFDLIRASCPWSNAQDATSLRHRPQSTVIGEDLASNIQAQEARRESTSVSGGDLPSPSAHSEAPVSSRRRTLRTVQHSRSASHVGDDDSLSSDPGGDDDDDDDYRGGGGGGGSDGSDDEARSSSQAVRPTPALHLALALCALPATRWDQFGLYSPRAVSQAQTRAPKAGRVRPSRPPLRHVCALDCGRSSVWAAQRVGRPNKPDLACCASLSPSCLVFPNG
jgi:hypothetical protein